MHYCETCGQPRDAPLPAPQPIGDFTLEVAADGRWQLRKGDRVAPVEPRAVEILLFLVQRGRATHETLMARFFLEAECDAAPAVYTYKIRRALRTIESAVRLVNLGSKGRAHGYSLDLAGVRPA